MNLMCIERGWWHISVEALSLTTYRVSQTITSYTRWLSRLSETRTYLEIACQQMTKQQWKHSVVFWPHTIFKRIKIKAVTLRTFFLVSNSQWLRLSPLITLSGGSITETRGLRQHIADPIMNTVTRRSQWNVLLRP